MDRDRRPDRFLLTGSAHLLLLPKLGDSLAGRMAILELQPLTAAEQERRPGGSLAAWLAGKLPGAFYCMPGPIPFRGDPRFLAVPLSKLWEM